ncbi:MAG TPA: serine/threonine-protein kinase [Planctomycetota bacterium]|nr:serine/threonine-protein kinase [Planctomycetota bacterium]
MVEGTPRPDPEVRPPAADPIVLKNRIAVLSPEPIAEGAFGKVYVGKILNPVGLLAERIVWGEENPRWLGIDDIPYEEPGRDLAEERRLPVPIVDPAQRRRIYQAAERLWNDYLERRRQDRDRADEEYRDLLNLIDPLLHEDRIIAVKVLRPPADPDPDQEQKIIVDSVRRFIKENDILRTLRHPGIVRRFGLVRDQRMGWCLLLEYIEGETLDAHLRRCPEGRLPLPRAVQLAREIAEAIEYIHARGVVHRDLKPQNIMIRKDDGRAVLTDFGIGKWADESHTQQFTQSGVRIGTPRYMAPEQARAEGPVGQEADVYQLATILFELVTGRAAYEGMEHGEVFRWLTDPARRHPTYVRDHVPGISRELEAVIEVGREKDPGRRWTIEEFRDRLERVAAEGLYEERGPAHEPDCAELVEHLREVRIRAKELAWEEHVLQRRLDLARLRRRLEETWDLLRREAYLEAGTALEGILKDVQAFPARTAPLRAEVEALERAFRRAKAKYEAEYLLTMAEQHFAARRYPDVGAALDAASERLRALPREGYGPVHERFQALSQRYDAQHRSFVELLETLRKSFIEKIQERVRELSDLAAAGRPPDASRLAELLSQAATVERNLRTVDREKVGPAAFDATQKDLADLRAALEALLRRTASPAPP